jgi:hypothetical protein
VGVPDEYLGGMEDLKTELLLKQLFALRGVIYVDHL